MVNLLEAKIYKMEMEINRNKYNQNNQIIGDDFDQKILLKNKKCDKCI